MKLSSKLVSFTLAASVILGISSMASAGGGMEGHGGGFGGWGHSSNSMRLIADLTPVSPYKIGQGEFRFVASTSGSNSSLSGGATLPVDGKIIDSNGAAGATVTLALASATCTLKIAGIRFATTYSSTTPMETADYDLSGHSSSTGTPAFGAGSCLDASSKPVLPQIVSGTA